MGKQRIERRYYKKPMKDQSRMISGLPLPVDEDGVVRDKYFVQCDFHPSCGEVEFENCEFSGCPGLDYLVLRKPGCITKLSSSFCG